MKSDDIPLSGNVFSDMEAFDKKYGFDNVSMTMKFLSFRMRFLVEELAEGIVAIQTGDPMGFVDAMIDLIVVAAGTLSIGKVDSQLAWNEVRQANMSKIRKTNPNRSGSGGADLVKPDGWQAPGHAGNIGQFINIDPREFEQHFPHSISVLFEAIKVQFKKYEDYNNGLSGVERNDYWIHGISDLEYEMNKKLIRFRSVLALLKAGQQPNFESEKDSLIDDINYHSFAVALLRGREPGQDPAHNIFNEPEPEPSSVDKMQALCVEIECDLRETARNLEDECGDDNCSYILRRPHSVRDHK